MFVEMVCNCEASISIEIETSPELLWSFATRFASAHVKCGFMEHDHNSWESDMAIKDISQFFKKDDTDEDEEEDE